MKKTLWHWLFVFLVVVVLLTATILFATLIKYDQKTTQPKEIEPIEIIGDYSEEGGPWQPLTRETVISNWDLRDITVRGHFSKELPPGSKLFLNIDHLRLAISINGAEIFVLEPVPGDGNPTKALGKQWVTVVSPGISTTDVVEINFGNLYRNAYMIQFDELLWQMRTGNEQMMIFEGIRLDGWTMGVGAMFVFLTLFLLIIALGCGFMRIKGAKRFLWLGLTTLFSSLWFFTLSPAPTLILPLPVFLNVLYAFSMQAMAIFFVVFATDHVYGWRRTSLLAGIAVLVLILQIALVFQILGIFDLYAAINYFSVFDVAIAIWLIFCLSYEAYKLKSREATEFLKAMLPLGFFGVVELINGYVQFSKASIMFGWGLIFLVVAEGIYTLRRIKQSLDNEKRVLLLGNELNQSRIAIMLSQIQPHFLYNTLNSISALCQQDPAKAEEMVDQFADFLRGNLDSLTAREPIPFLQEKRHLEIYLEIEKTRFRDVLNIEYDYRVTDFSLPCLTLQPVVENAVRYGVTKKKGGGTVKISSWETDSAFLLQVADDGIGFMLEDKEGDGRSHIGLENVESRLQAQCGGSLQIESQPKNGTVVTITIPKQGAKMDEE